MSPIQPFIFDAYYSWITENGMTPHIHINCVRHNVDIPQSAVSDDGTAILNISMSSAHNFTVTGGVMSFNASFSGRREAIMIPLEAVMAIYARENPSMGTILYDNVDEEPVDSGVVMVDAQSSTVQPAPKAKTYTTLRAVNTSPNTVEPDRSPRVKPKLSLIH